MVMKKNNTDAIPELQTFYVLVLNGIISSRWVMEAAMSIRGHML